MRTKYKYKLRKEALVQKYLTSDENLSSYITNKNRILVNTKKYLKKSSRDNTTKNDSTKKSEISYSKENNPKINSNIIGLGDKNNSQRNKINNKIPYVNNINKSEASKKTILKIIFNEEKKPFNNEYNKSQDEKLKNRSTFKCYRSNRLHRNKENSNDIKNFNNNTEQINSIRSHSIRNFYKNASLGTEKNNIESNKIEKTIYDKHLQTRLFKKNYFKEHMNEFEKKYEEKVKEKDRMKENEKVNNKESYRIEKDNEKNIKKEKGQIYYIKEKDLINIEKEKDKYEINEANIIERNNFKKFKKFDNKEEKNIKIGKIQNINNIDINNNHSIDNELKKKIQIRKTKNKSISPIITDNENKSNLNFLIHEAHENQLISHIFNKLYDSCPNITQTKKNSETENNNINNTNNNIANNNKNNDINNNFNINDNDFIINKTNITSINNSNNTSKNQSNNCDNEIGKNKIKSMKSIYSFLKTHSRNNCSDYSVYNSSNEKNDYKYIYNSSCNNREEKIIHNIIQKERNESMDDKPSIKINISNFKYIYNNSEANNNNKIKNSNSSYINNYDFPNFKVIYKNNKLKNSFKKNKNEINSNENEKVSEKEIKVENKIINNNTFNTTYNIFKINNNVLQQNSKNIDFDINQKKSEFQLNSAYINKSKKNIDFEIIFIIEEKLMTIINRINKYEVCDNECYDFITCYFYHQFYDKEIDLFQMINNKNNILNIIKDEIICFFLCYEISFSVNFNRISILLKAIFQLLQNNYLILVNFILNNNYAKFNNDDIDLLNQILNLIGKNLINKDIINEDNVIQLITENFKQINNYYLMIIDNIYPHNNNSNLSSNLYSFPECLNLDKNKLTDIQKNNIIISFFYEANKVKQNYTVQNLKKFFDLYLNRTKNSLNYDNNLKNILKKSNSSINLNKNLNNKDNNIKLLKINQNKNYIYINENMNINYYLPPIKKPYKYTLVLDLDETLIYYKIESSKNSKKPKNVLILRPNLILFLREMKKIFELVLFSYATYDYIEKILKIIESKEKFFEYILDRRHITYENGSFVKNLSLIGRDLKNVIIIDDKPQAFKMNQENGIFIKPFYGDCLNNKNILKNLINILKDIRKDVEITGDIKKSIQKKKHEIFTKITTGLND